MNFVTWIALSHCVDVRCVEDAHSRSTAILQAHANAQKYGCHGSHQKDYSKHDPRDRSAPGIVKG